MRHILTALTTSSLNVSFTKRFIKHVFPTALSPRRTTLKSTLAIFNKVSDNKEKGHFENNFLLFLHNLKDRCM